MYGLRDLFQAHAGGDHHHRFADQGGGVVGEEVDADDAVALLVGDDFDEALRLGGDHGFGIDGHGHFHFRGVAAFGLGLFDGQADERRFRTREDDAAVFVLVGLHVFAEDVGGGDAALLPRGVREHVAADDVADREDVRHAGAAAGVGYDHAFIHRDAGVVQFQRFEHGAFAGGHDDVIAGDRGLLAFAVFEHELHLAGLAFDLADLGAGVEGEARIIVQDLREDLRDLGLDLGEDARLRLDQHDFAAEVLEDLRHLDADGAATDHGQGLRHVFQPPHGVGGEHAAALHAFARAGDGRHERRRAGGDDRAAEGDVFAFAAVAGRGARVAFGLIVRRVDEDAVIGLERGVALDDFDLDASVGLERHLDACLEHLAESLFEFGPVEARVGGVLDAEVIFVFAVADAVGRRAPCLRRYAAAPQTFAAGQRRVVDHRDFQTVLGEIARAVFAAGSAADHDHVVIPIALGNRGAHWAYPLFRLLDLLLQRGQKHRDVGAVHHAVIGGDGERHAVFARRRNREDRRRAGRGNRVEIRDAEHAHVRDHDGRVRVFFGREAALARALDEAAPRFIQFFDGLLLGVTQHRHHQAATVGGHGHADVDVAALDDLVDRLITGIHARVFLDRFGAGLGDRDRHRHAFLLRGLDERAGLRVHRHAEGRHGERGGHRMAHGLFHRRHRAAFAGHLHLGHGVRGHRRDRAGGAVHRLRFQYIVGGDLAVGAGAAHVVEIHVQLARELARV